jgi:hypothetical protein
MNPDHHASIKDRAAEPVRDPGAADVTLDIPSHHSAPRRASGRDTNVKPPTSTPRATTTIS